MSKTIVNGKRYEEGKFVDVDVDITASLDAKLWLVDDPDYHEYDRMLMIPGCATPEDAARRYAAWHKANDLAPPASYHVYPLHSLAPVSKRQLAEDGDGCWSAFQNDMIVVRL